MLVELKVGYIVFEMLVFHRGCELITFCKERIVINERHIARKAQYEALVRVRVDVYGCFLKLVVPPKHPKMIIFSRKTHGCWVPPFKETPIY